jgi:hypothetical protein
VNLSTGARVPSGAAGSPRAESGDSDGAGLIELVEDSFAAVGSVVEKDYALAGRRVRVRAGSEEVMRRLSRAFTHLEAPRSGEPELTIHLWDSATTGAPPPPLPETAGDEPPGAFWYYSDARLRVGFQHGTSGDARVLAVYPHPSNSVLSVLDSERRTGWYWVEDAERIPYWEQATPMVYLLDWWLQSNGAHLLHAGAVGRADGGVLLVGKSGSGKSTCALSALGSALLYGGDDYVAVSLEPQPWVHSLYSSGKLMPDHLERLAFLRAGLANPGELEIEKAVVYPHEQWPHNVTAGFPLLAILAPKVTPGALGAQAREVSALAGLAALAPSTVFQMHTRGQDSLASMRRLAEAVPSYRLELGADVSSIAPEISRLIERLADER